jgi:type II secretory ATPase GspE/PulE/Tfp pilus assembly ATPase PilB-like protein
VFSTLHTNDAVTSIARLIDIGIDPFLVASTLDMVVAQRLVRILCPHCKEPVPPGDAAYRSLPTDPQGGQLFSRKGCERCRSIGYAGRTVIYELLKITPALKDLITGRAGIGELRREAAQGGFVPMIETGHKKARMGVTTLEEVRSVARTTS